MKTREEALQNIINIIENDRKYTKEELESVEWLEEVFTKGVGEIRLVEEFIDLIAEYNYYLVLLVKEENYELADIFKKGINIMTTNLISTLRKYFNTNEEVLKEIEEIPLNIYNALLTEEYGDN
jgi:hypothetical protein